MGQIGLLLLLVTFEAFAVAPEPHDATFYSGQMALTGDAPAAWIRDMRGDSQNACRNIHRALYLIESRYPKVRKFFVQGVNFSVLHKNKEFYVKRLTARFRACATTGVPLYRYGRCNTEQQTLAFVRVTLGFVHSTINLCDEYFGQQAYKRTDTLVHEFGRLEDIGDASGREPNNIYVWDAIVGRLSDEQVYDELKKP